MPRLRGGQDPATFNPYSSVSRLPSVEVTVYPYECDAYGHMNEAAYLQL